MYAEIMVIPYPLLKTRKLLKIRFARTTGTARIATSRHKMGTRWVVPEPISSLVWDPGD